MGEQLLPLAVLAAGAVMAFFGWRLRKAALAGPEPGAKSTKKRRKWGAILAVSGLWLAAVQGISLIFGPGEPKGFAVEISPPRMQLGSFSVSSTVVITWIAMAVILLLALLLRLLVVPRMKDVPGRVQNLLELTVDGLGSYVESKVHGMGEGLSAYLFSLAVLLVACAGTELFALRAPTTDITMTLSLALVTFFMINYYGFRHKGFIGRIRALSDPTPVVFPLRVLSDLAVPISMACRLFGNMLGGLVVMELLYSALGNAGLGIPSVAGLYFNVFHPLIQAFIFITLTLTFIGEATE